MNYIIGIDGGGSRTRCFVGNHRGEILGQGEGGPANLVTMETRPVRESLEEAILGAMMRADLLPDSRCLAICAGLAGAASGHGQDQILQVLHEITGAAKIEVTTDLHIALAGALPPGPGILIAAGTGSAALGRDANGTLIRTGGFGPLLGDEGSGFWVGKEAIKALLRADEGRGEKTLLANLLAPIRGKESWPLFCRQSSPAQIAALFPKVVEAAAAGDGPARVILEWAGRELADLAAAVARQIGSQTNLNLSWTGGILPNSPLTMSSFTTQAAKLGLQAVAPITHPGGGAVNLALEAAQGD